MTNRISNWLAERRVLRAQRQWDNGYDYAAGALLRGGDPGEIEADIEMSESFDPTPWDRGARAALAHWARRDERDHANVIYTIGYDANGKRVVSGTMSSFDPQRDSHVMSTAWEFNNAARRGVKIENHRVGDLLISTVPVFTEDEKETEPRIRLNPEAYERRADGKVVRKDRWEWGIRNIVTSMWGSRSDFEVNEVVTAVCKLLSRGNWPEDAEHDEDNGAYQCRCLTCQNLFVGYKRRVECKVCANANAWPEGLLERVKAAEQRVADGHAPRRIPADPTDVDLVLAEVRYLIEGKAPPFWIKASAKAAEVPA